MTRTQFRKALAILAALTAATPAMAQKVIPPVEFDHPYRGDFVILRLKDQAEIRANCGPTTLPYHLGCGQRATSGICVMILATDEFIRSKGWSPEIVLRHEIGHCNGWPADHKGAR